MTPTFEDVITAILSGKFDDQLGQLDSVIRDRGKSISKAVLYSLKPGDKVRFNDRARPAYLVGKFATVCSVNRETVVIDLVEPTVRFYKNIRCNPALVEKA